MDDRYKNIKTKVTVSVGHVTRLLESPYREKQGLNFSYRGFYETTDMTYTQPGRRRAEVDDRYKNIKTKVTVSVGHVTRLLESPYREKQGLNFSYRGFYETTDMTYTRS